MLIDDHTTMQEKQAEGFREKAFEEIITRIKQCEVGSFIQPSPNLGPTTVAYFALQKMGILIASSIFIFYFFYILYIIFYIFKLYIWNTQWQFDQDLQVAMRIPSLCMPVMQVSDNH